MQIPYHFLIYVGLAVIILELLTPRKNGRRRSQSRIDPRMPNQPETGVDTFDSIALSAKFKVRHIRRSLMTNTEKSFFRQLRQAGSSLGFLVAPQVAMSSIIDIPARQNRSYYKHINRASFAQKRLDFVLLDEETLEPLLVVELDDPSHDGREAEDLERAEILEKTGHQLLRIDVRENLSTVELEQRVKEILFRGKLGARR